MNVKNLTIKKLIELVTDRENELKNMDIKSLNLDQSEFELLMKDISIIKDKLNMCNNIQKCLTNGLISKKLYNKYRHRKKMMVSTVVKTIMSMKL